MVYLKATREQILKVLVTRETMCNYTNRWKLKLMVVNALQQMYVKSWCCVLKIYSMLHDKYISMKAGRKKGQRAVEGLVGRECYFSEGSPQKLACWDQDSWGLLQNDIPFCGQRGELSNLHLQLPPEKQLALSKQIVLSCWDFKSFRAKNKSIVENPKRWSASLTSGGRAPLPHVQGAGLPALIINSNLGSGGAACWFPETLERKTQILL